MSFTKRHIDLEFQLGQGSFSGTSQNTVEVTGLQCSATISKAGGWSNSTLDLRVWGLPLSVMNDLSTLGKPLPAIRNNVITVKPHSDDTGETPTVAFIGVIQQAWADMGGIPDSIFTVQATSGFFEQLRPLPPTSVRGPADVAQIMASLAKQMEMNFENSGVQIQSPTIYLSGSGKQQATQLMDAAKINMIIDNSTLAIWPRGGVRNPQATPILIAPAPDGNMVGYPTWTANGLVIKNLYDININYGCAIRVDCDITPANGLWSPYKIDHTLESETPDGQWFTMAEASAFGRPSVAQ